MTRSEANTLDLSRNLIQRPDSLRLHHFSLGTPSFVLHVHEKHLPTKYSREVEDDDGVMNQTQKRNIAGLSMKPAAIRKRKLRNNRQVRERKRKRANIANAQKRKQPGHATKLAERRAARATRKCTQLISVEKSKSTTVPQVPYTSYDGIYKLEYEKTVKETLRVKHVYIPDSNSSYTCKSDNVTPVCVKFDSNGRASAQSILFL